MNAASDTNTVIFRAQLWHCHRPAKRVPMLKALEVSAIRPSRW